MYALVARFAEAFPPGTRFTTVEVAADDVPNVRVLASGKDVLVVNTLDRAVDAEGRRQARSPSPPTKCAG